MHKQSGFSLVELSIVILIIGLILGGIAMPLSTQLENGRIRETRTQIDQVGTAIEGFAVLNGQLPCPATPSSNGFAAVTAGTCDVQHGFVPASTLGLVGPRNDDNLLLDSWANPLRYSVTASDVDSDGSWDFTVAGEMRDVTMVALAPDLVVCSSSTGSTPVACSGLPETLTNTAPLVVFSMGKDWSSFSSADQQENVGATLGGGPSGANYAVPADPVSVNRQFSIQPGNEFDDIVYWLPSTILYHQMIAAGQLP